MGSSDALRGAFIVLEGLDRCGKSTQSSSLVKLLRSKNVRVEHMVFPDRGTPTGVLINNYLTNKNDFSDKKIHQLFADNRWELQSKMQDLLLGGTTLVVDRYSYSGIAYTVAKGLDFEWCKSTEVGLIKPDLVIYLEADVDQLALRSNYGEERYERVDFQKKVAKAFESIYETEKDYWKKINACQDMEKIKQLVAAEVELVISKIARTPLQLLWK